MTNKVENKEEKKVKKEKHNRIFSKALFKQSCKANGTMWLIITLAVCFMLSCVMLISGTSGISQVKEGIEETIIKETIKSEIKKEAIKLYDAAVEGELVFDQAFVEKFNELNTRENYNKVGSIIANAQSQGESLVGDSIAESVGGDVAAILGDKVGARVTELVTAEVTSRITNEITESVKAKTTAGVEAQLEADYNDAVARIAAENPGAPIEQVEAQAEAETYTQEHIQSTITAVTAEHGAEYLEQAKAEILTDEHKKEVANQVLAEKKDEFINQAKGEVVTDDAKKQAAELVVKVKGQEYANEALKKHQDEINSLKDKAKNEAEEVIKNTYVKTIYEYAAKKVQSYYPEKTKKAELGATMVAINPDNKAKDQYEKNNEPLPEEYVKTMIKSMSEDILSWGNGNPTKKLEEYIYTDERSEVRNSRARTAVAMLTASEMVKKENKQKILDKLKEYKVTEETYDSYGFDYDMIKTTAYEALLEYQDKIEYEVKKLPEATKNNETLLKQEVTKIHENLLKSIGGSLLDKLPKDVTDGIKELGTMDLYGLIVGSIFYKMAGLLLPIIYIIMVSNNLIASQVDTGSMAYILSTSTKRKEVTFTQAVYLMGSILLMFILTTITSLVCFSIVEVKTDLTYSKLLLINLGAFITMFAVSGINFFTSCYFDRSKKAMAIGGGISMFFLVATMLGLFGSPVIPAVVRIKPLNNFNFVSIISLFDVVSMLKGGYEWILKLVLLVVLGITGYVAGAVRFKKKDLPL